MTDYPDTPLLAIPLLCWHCQAHPQEKGSKICRPCRKAGIDPLFIPCTAHGWDHVRKRTGPGRHLFTCQHPDQPLTADID